MVLGVDADEVLWDCLACFVAYHNRHYGTDLTAHDFATYNWWETLNCTRQEVFERYMAFHASGAGYAMPVKPGALEALQLIVPGLAQPPVIITSRVQSLEAETRHLVTQHFPNIFSDIYFGSQFSENKRSKSEMCLALGVTTLIEDQLFHALECSAAGIDVLLFGEYSWNRPKEKLPANVTPVADWSHVLRELGVTATV